MERVKAYVNGFNLYHGLKTRHGHKYLWLDLQALAVRLLKPSQHLVAVEHFTARVRNQAESEQRQAVYLDALAAHYPLVKVVQGRFQKRLMSVGPVAASGCPTRRRRQMSASRCGWSQTVSGACSTQLC